LARPYEIVNTHGLTTEPIGDKPGVISPEKGSIVCREGWENPIRENIKISAKVSLGYYELKKHKPWFDEGCSKLLDQRKQAKLQWLQDPEQYKTRSLQAFQE
jgi:hypothetical protein